VAVAGITTDFWGNAHANPPSIGAHEGSVNAFSVAWHANSEIDPLATPVQTFSGLSAPAMDVPALTSVDPLDTLRGAAGTMDVPALTSVDPLDTLRSLAGTMDVPSLANVWEGDTLRGVAGGLLSDWIIDSVGGNYRIAGLLEGNILAGVDFGLVPHQGTRVDADPAAVLDTEPPFGDPLAPLVPAFNLAAWELLRNSPADPNLYEVGHSFKQFGAMVNGLLPLGGVIVPPFCPGVIDAQPYAQGCIKVRFYEMYCYQGAPYRYDFHVKRLIDGPLTLAEINAGTYYSCSFYQDQIGPDLYTGSPFGDFGIGEVVIAVESPGDAGDNIHLFTNQQYQVAVRAVAIQSGIVGIDDNDAVAIAWSSGYQGIAHIDIIDWPCLELCTPIDLSNVQITALPAVTIASPLPPVSVQKMPNLDVHPHKRGE